MWQAGVPGRGQFFRDYRYWDPNLSQNFFIRAGRILRLLSAKWAQIQYERVRCLLIKILDFGQICALSESKLNIKTFGGQVEPSPMGS